MAKARQVLEGNRSSRAGKAAVVFAAIVGLVLPMLPATQAVAAGEITASISRTTGRAPFDEPRTFDVYDGAGNRTETRTNSTLPGQDVSADDSYVRINDYVDLLVNVATAEEPVNQAIFTLEIASGFELSQVPAYCKAGSTLSDPLPAPQYNAAGTDLLNRVTTANPRGLPPQTLNCELGDLPAGALLDYPVALKVRPEVEHGFYVERPFGGSKVQGRLGSGFSVSEDMSMTDTDIAVTGAVKYDLSKWGTQFTEDGQPNGFIHGLWQARCTNQSNPTDPAAQQQDQCVWVGYPILLSVPDGGTGAIPGQRNFSYTDDITLDSMFGAGTVDKLIAAYAAQPNGSQLTQDQARIRFGARLRDCNTDWQSHQSPGTSLVNATGAPIAGRTPQNSVRNSGKQTCSFSGATQRWDQMTAAQKVNYYGSAVNVNVTGADLTAYTVPTLAGTPLGFPLPTDDDGHLTDGYVYAGRIALELPIETLQLMDWANTNAGSGTKPFPNVTMGTDGPQVPFTNTLKDLNLTGIDGSTSGGRIKIQDNRYYDPARSGAVWESNADPNNKRVATFRYADRVRLQTFFVGDPDDPTRTPGSLYAPGYPGYVGPPGYSGQWQGNNVAVPGQNVIAGNYLVGNVQDGPNSTAHGSSVLSCQAIDTSKTYLTTGVATNPATAGVGALQNVTSTRMSGGGSPCLCGSWAPTGTTPMWPAPCPRTMWCPTAFRFVTASAAPR